MARPFQVKSEMQINGTWTDVTSDVYGKNGDDGSITIVHGQSDQQSNVSPDSCTFTLDQRDGTYANRNPLSPYYGHLPRNTRVRHSVLDATKGMDLYSLHTEPEFSGLVSTADKASLDIVGDIDIRMELEPAYGWRPPVDTVLAAKWTSNAGARSWALLLMQTGKLRVYTSTDGANISLTLESSSAIPIDSTPRLAVRFALDVNLGGTQKTQTFYTSDSITGTWTQLSTATTAGVTTIFSGSADLEIGSANAGSSSFTNSLCLFGKIYGFELYSGIAGTLVADYKPNKTGNVPGTTSWADACAAPNTWTVVTKTRITSDRIRFIGEMTNLPTTWDETRRDVFIPVQAYGPSRRYARAGTLITSPIYRNLNSQASTNLYFPFEDGSGTTVPQGARGSGIVVVGNDYTLTGASPTGLAGSAGSVKLNSSASFIQVSAAGRSAAGTATALVYFKMSSLPVTGQQFISFSGNGATVSTWGLFINTTSYTLNGYAPDGSTVATGSALFGTGANPTTTWIGFELILTTETTNVRWEALWHAVGTSTFYTFTAGGSTYAGSVGRLNVIRLDACGDSAVAGAEFAHGILGQSGWRINTSTFAQISSGYIGETAGARIRRLAAEQSQVIDVWGDIPTISFNSAALGAQRIAPVFDLYQDAAQADGGLLGEARDRIGLVYYTSKYLANRRGVALSESSGHLASPPKISDDDRNLVNDYTATRTNGASARAIASDVTYGPNNILDPPDGIGQVPGGNTFNVATDSQLPGIASFQLFWRTWDEPRIPNLEVGLHRTDVSGNAGLTAGLVSTYVASGITLSGLLAQVSYDSLRMLVLGYTEKFNGFTWTLVFNTVPATPYNVPRADLDDTSSGRVARADASNSVLNADITSTATTFVINTLIRSRWITGSSSPDFPILVMMGGELISIGQITGTGTTQTASSCIRSVNGVVKAQIASTPIYVRDAAYIGLR